ncbi:MAG: MFS transporter [Clostridiales bacterium]|nr:MFS transporter [Clostridiales bacterium]
MDEKARDPHLSWISFAALASVPFVMVLSNSMIIPVLPDIQKALDINLFRAGLLITAFSATAAAIIPIGGTLSDRLGRRPIILWGLFLFGLGGLWAGLSPLLFSRPYLSMMAGRILQGLGAGGMYQVAMALAGDLVPGPKRVKVLGGLEAANGMGKVLSPLMGAAAALIIWYAPFFLYPVLAWGAALLLYASIPAPNEKGSQESVSRLFSSLGAIARVKGLPLLTAFLAASLAIFFLFGVLSLFADRVEKPFGIKGFAKGLIIAIPVAVLALTSYTAGTLLQGKLGRWAKVAVGSGLSLLALSFVAMFFFTEKLWPFTAALSLMGLGSGLLLPALNTLITSSVSTRRRGLITSLYGSVRFGGAALGPPVYSMAMEAGKAWTFLGSAALAALTLALSLAFIRQDQLLKPVPPSPGDPASGEGEAEEREEGRPHGDPF